MRPTMTFTAAGLAIAMVLAGCANDPNSGLTTASVAKPKTAQAAVDPTCTALAAMINSARQEGTPARVQAVAANTNKSRTVNIKRASLAKVAELDKLNAEFQMKCSKYPGLQTASTRPTIAQPATVPTTAQKPAKPTTTAANQPIVSVPKQ